MKGLKRFLSSAVVFVVLMMAFWSVSFAAEVQYIDNVIPTMTSNTAPSGVASASSTFDSNYPAWRAFNHIYASGRDAWASAESYGWLAYDFPDAKCISKYTITSRNLIYSIAELPEEWTFEGWNEQLGQWTVLDTRKNVTGWEVGVKKEFTFSNAIYYNKYRINITANGGKGIVVVIGELEMMEAIISSPAAPTKLTATSGNTKVDLSWTASEDTTSYNIKRSTTAGGPYTTIATTSSAIYTDKGLENGTTYYYVVSAINASGESIPSNEVSATITQPTNQLKLVLEVNGEKQLSISDELSDNTEMEWTSSDSTIATVDVNGKVKALKSGNTVITCTSEDKSYTESINVLVVDLEYQLAVDLTIGDTCRLTIDDLANTANVTWSSYDPTIATVSAKGKVTAISEGLTYVVVSDKDGNEIGKIYIRVRQ